MTFRSAIYQRCKDSILAGGPGSGRKPNGTEHLSNSQFLDLAHKIGTAYHEADKHYAVGDMNKANGSVSGIKRKDSRTLKNSRCYS